MSRDEFAVTETGRWLHGEAARIIVRELASVAQAPPLPCPGRCGLELVDARSPRCPEPYLRLDHRQRDLTSDGDQLTSDGSSDFHVDHDKLR